MIKRFGPLFALLCLFALPARGQVAVGLAPQVHFQFTDGTGKVLAGGFLYTYAPGTTSRQDTYTDSNGTIVNAWPIPLDSSGSPSNGSTQTGIWIPAASFKFCAYSSALVLQWCTDNVPAAPFLAGNNPWTGNQTFAGSSTFNGLAALTAGGSLNGVFTGSPSFSGNPTFSGAPIFSGVPSFTSGFTTDIINGITVGGQLAVTGAAGEGAELLGGTATGSNTGGGVTLQGGNGGPSGGVGGGMTLATGNAQSGNNAGGSLAISTGSGVGTANGGSANFNGGTGGSTAGNGGSLAFQAGGGGAGGNGGNLSLTTGSPGAGGKYGNLVFGGNGHLQFNVPVSSVAPTCAATGIGGAGTCTLANYSTDTSGTMILTPAAGVSSIGNATLTFNQTMGANGTFCMYTIVSGTGLWNNQASVQGVSDSSTNSVSVWINNSVNLTAASTYLIRYFCRGEN